MINNIFEIPWQIPKSATIDNNKIEFINIQEICQGCPEVGTLVLNNKIIDKYKFTAPYLIVNNNLIIPRLNKSLLNTNFKVSKINFSSLEVKDSIIVSNLIILNQFEDNKITYFTSKNNNEIKSFDYKLF